MRSDFPCGWFASPTYLTNSGSKNGSIKTNAPSSCSNSACAIWSSFWMNKANRWLAIRKAFSNRCANHANFWPVIFLKPLLSLICLIQRFSCGFISPTLRGEVDLTWTELSRAACPFVIISLHKLSFCHDKKRLYIVGCLYHTDNHYEELKPLRFRLTAADSRYMMATVRLAESGSCLE